MGFLMKKMKINLGYITLHSRHRNLALIMLVRGTRIADETQHA